MPPYFHMVWTNMCMYTYMYVYIYIHMCVYTYICVCVYICMYIHIYTHTNSHRHKHTHMYIHMHIHLHIYTSIHQHILVSYNTESCYGRRKHVVETYAVMWAYLLCVCVHPLVCVCIDCHPTSCRESMWWKIFFFAHDPTPYCCHREDCRYTHTCTQLDTIFRASWHTQPCNSAACSHYTHANMQFHTIFRLLTPNKHAIPHHFQIIIEHPVERIVEKPYIRKVIIERIIEQVCIYKKCAYACFYLCM